MSKHYIEKVIDEKVSFEPDYSKIKEQVNIKTKKTKQKSWIWPSLSIGLVCIAVIVANIVSLSLRSDPNPTPNPTYDGVHFNNYTSNGGGSGDGEPLPPPPMVSYSIDVEKDNYEYNEEFIIKYTIKGMHDLGVYDDYIESCNNLNVKIVSDKFEFLSPTEYHFDLETDSSTYGNILSFGNEEKTKIFPIEMELKVKAKEKSETVDSILFLLEFPLKEEFKEMLNNHYDKGETYQYMSDEFTKDFEWIHRFYYLNDELGTLLVDNAKRFKCYDVENEITFYISAYNEILYRSLNRLYEKQLVTKQEYMKRLVGYLSNYKTYAKIFVGTVINGEPVKDEAYMEYISKNIRVHFSWRPEYLELYEKYYGLTSDTHENLAKELVEILYRNELLTLEQYMIEIQTIEEEGVISRSLQMYKVFIPFKDYRDYYYDLEI